MDEDLRGVGPIHIFPSMLKNKIALITGASSGIGEATAVLFAEHGASVVLADMDTGGAERVRAHIEKRGGHALVVAVDVSKPADNAHVVNEAVKVFGRLDIAVNNAGIGGPAATVGEYPTDGWDKVIGINLSGVFYGMRYQIPAMLKNGGGSIVNMASILGKVGFPMSSAYAAAKHGVIGLTGTAACEYATKGIRVNAVGPGFIKTPLLDKNMNEDQLKGIAAMHPMQRLGTAQEVAELVLWLASDKASFVTGAYYNVDGGYLAQ
jgi:NAD(P)-dependent dehydrogenase (short-subunit alcohol dehydrogenase family)